MTDEVLVRLRASSLVIEIPCQKKDDERKGKRRTCATHILREIDIWVYDGLQYETVPNQNSPT